MEGIFSLTAYSILAQAGVGMSVMLFIAGKVIGLKEENRKQYVQGYAMATLLTAAAMLLSMTHLGMPLRAPNAILNIASSWLSREIFFNGMFFGCVALTAFLLYKKKPGAGLLSALAAISGILCIFSQASIYANTVMPAWGHGHAYVTFLGAMIAMGCVLSGIFFYRHDEEAYRKFFIIGGSLLIVSILAQAGIYAYLAGGLALMGPAGTKSLLLLQGKNMLLTASFLFLTIGLLTCICQYHRRKAGAALYLMAALIVLGEVLNRMIFYGIGVPMGL
ncbi:MAG: dimethyl sulfoxide reductase anchor subunit [Selenomonas sp.]|uniref:dimethyl sulfoxide reductase anchor subunit family protein n=1 Tax=Selenomonas sp. TaxID=2053611 RepID=UPI0025DF5EAB|nr:DmsC/YnfH family molybdoenzyme membrane anchor subunit [Selenomonas sp.]MCR5758591.1 dimethyl sulfoxide reductase anchor subunit [Selenomonas sp.]